MQHARLVAVVGILWLVTAVANAEDAPQLAPGSRVRVKISSEEKRLVGKLLGLDNKNLTLQIGEERVPSVLSRDQITDLDISAGRRSLGRRALYGLVIGAVTGAVIGVTTTGTNAWVSQNEMAGGLAVVLGGVGALVGMVAIPAERWRSVPLKSVQVSLGPVRAGGAGVFVAVGF